MKKYRGASGKIYNIDPEPIAKGGEGTICAVEGADDIVAKIYKQEKRTKRRLEKLSLMIRYQLTDIQRRQVTWPLDVIYEESGFAVILCRDFIVLRTLLWYVVPGLRRSIWRIDYLSDIIFAQR